MDTAATAARPVWPELTASELEHAIAGAIDAAASGAGAKKPLRRLLEALGERVPELRVAVFGRSGHLIWAIAQQGYSFVPDGLVGDPETESRRPVGDETRFVPSVAGSAYMPIDPRAVSAVTAVLGTVPDQPGLLVVESVTPLPAETPELVGALIEAVSALYAKAIGDERLDARGLSRVLAGVSKARDPSAIADIAVMTLRLVLPLETAQLTLFGGHGVPTNLSTWSAGDAQPLSPRSIASLRSTVPERATLEVLTPGRAQLPEGDEDLTIVWLPLRADGEEIGVLAGTSRWLRQVTIEGGSIAVLLASHVSATLGAALALKRERLSALTDPLTGILNRRGFELRLESELAAATESGQPLSVLVLDCDDFKDVNDRAGHAFGDALLQEAAEELSGAVEDAGIAARIGGDEFVVILPGATREDAVARAEEIRGRFANALADAGFPLRISVGIATSPFDGVSGQQLVRAADQALYRAKERGKDQVMAFREIADQAATAPATAPTAGSDRRRRGERADTSAALADICNAATLIWAEPDPAAVLERLAKTVSFVVGATGCVVSRVVGETHLHDVAIHALRSTDLGPDWAYLIADFPLTEVVLRTREPRCLSFLDADIDAAEAYVLRELGMSCVLLVPLLVRGEVYGLVEVYDARLRQFTAEDVAVATYLVGQAGHCIERFAPELDGVPSLRPVWRLPALDAGR
jgi:diguanylate cyclase (GGDEF)-like protein